MRAILFDLDGTLLDIDIDAFLRRYFTALGPVVARVTGQDPHAGLDAVLKSVDAMCAPHPGTTNQRVFAATFERLTGIVLDDAAWSEFDRFYREEFPALGYDAGPAPGGREALERARDLGFTVAIATNPIFPRAAIDERLRWAGVDDVDVALVTSYEDMHACKPDGAYFRQVARRLEVEPADCLMIGDDPSLDLPAASVGMATFYVGGGGHDSDYRGSLHDLGDLLAAIASQRDA